MTIYQVYYWNEDFGPKVSFYGTKKKALTFAKDTAREAAINGTVDVSRVRFPSKKAAILFYLNCTEATMTMPVDKDIAEFEPPDDDNGGE